MLHYVTHHITYFTQCYICFTIYLVIEYNKIFYNQVVVLQHFMRRQLLYEKITISGGQVCIFEGLLVLHSDVPKESQNICPKIMGLVLCLSHEYHMDVICVSDFSCQILLSFSLWYQMEKV